MTHRCSILVQSRFLAHLAFLIICLPGVIGASSIASEANVLPQNFKASVGGFLGTTSVELREGALYYSLTYATQKTETVMVTPTVQQWREFRRALDEVNVWQWGTNYPNPGGVYDGTQWSLDIQYYDRALKTRGDNNFPGRKGKRSGSPKATKAFSAYTTAVKRLLGGKEFQ
jgi:hypothetical protein